MKVLYATSLLIVLSGCGGEGGQALSQKCERSVAAAAAEPDSAKANPLIVATLNACDSADQWLRAVARHPSAMGMTERAEIGRTEILSACYQQQATNVCRDAVAEGLVTDDQLR